MTNQELLEKFNTQLDAYAQVRGFIEKAKAQTDKFRPEVIEKVCLTHEIKSMELSEGILPLVADLQSSIAELESSINTIQDTKGGADEALEEMQLRLAIGELTDDQFEEESKSLQEEVSQADGQIGESQGELDGLRGALERWISLAGEAGHSTGVSAAEPEAEVEAEVEAEAVEEEEALPSLEMESEAFGAEPGEELDFGNLAEEGSAEIEASVEVADEPALEVSEDNELDPHEDSGVPGANDDDDFLAGEEPVIEADSTVAVSEEGEARRALLLYQEGTAEEQIYPFTDDEISIGRGRDNQIQIKNDSKVSRKHCILFRENDAFFIKDNKSSNGSLVNGELITERRLFGGEEIIIGETFFRFRIMD